MMEITWRYEVQPSDREAVREIVESAGFFSPAEVDVAVELVDERLARGPASGYHFVFAEEQGQPIGYACYGPISATESSFDLYWIAVHHDHRAHGLGRRIIAEAERLVHDAGGRRVYAETSGRAQYAPTRAFYERCQYRQEAVLEDFYALGDAKVIFVKVVG